MKKIILKIIPLLLLFLNFSYAQDFDLNALDLDRLNKSMSGISFNVPVPLMTGADIDKSSSMKEWTVMVYINGKNNLSGSGVEDVNEMEAVGSTGKMNIVVELGRKDAKTKRYFITKDKHPYDITSKTLETLYDEDMGDWKHLVDFASWARKKYPARRYMLIIWNHGDGWTTSKGISYDDETGNHISTPELGIAMKQIGRVDILAMDACLMQMIEVAFEVKDYADIIVASEETESGDGYPYDAIFKKMAMMTTASNEQIAKNIVTQYGSFTSPSKRATQSALKTDKLDSLVLLLNDWVKTAVELEDKTPIADAVSMTESYAINEYKDLSHFIEIAGEKTQDSVLQEKGGKINKFISDELIIANTSRRRNSNGVSIYLTKKGTGKKYAQLAWSQATQWDDFLNSIKGIASSFPENTSEECVEPEEDAPLAEWLDYLNCLLCR